MMGIFDSHAHYDDTAFDEDRDVLLSGLKDSGVELVVNVGSSIETTRKTIEIISRYPFVFGSAGIHPEECGDTTEADIDWIESVFDNKKIVAVGEIGLDYHYDEPPRDIQQKWFRRQLELAIKVGKPVIIHSRDAAEDTMNILKEYTDRLHDSLVSVRASVSEGDEGHNVRFGQNSDVKGTTDVADSSSTTDTTGTVDTANTNVFKTREIGRDYGIRVIPGVLHCFSNSYEMAKEYVKMGYLIGVGGVVTFKNAKKLREVVRNISIDNIIIETDCPYMAPEPHRGKRNNSSYLNHVVDKIAEIKGIDREEVIEITTDNALKMYYNVRL